MQNRNPVRYVRFDDFELDVETGALCKLGRSVKLRPQAATLLSLLASRPGTVVTREEIRSVLWSDGTVVDFDQSINFCVKRIRDVLSDDAATPRYVETLPRVGYRFIADTVPVPTSPTVTEATSRGLRPWRFLFVLSIAVLIGTTVNLSRLLERDVESPGHLQFRQLTFQGGEERHPSVSPNGLVVAYAGRDRGSWDIYLQRTQSDKAVNLTRNRDADDTHPAFSPDGEQLAFRSARRGGGIFVMDVNGDNVRQISNNGYNPHWSPDGKKLAYTIEPAIRPGEGWGQSDLWVVDVLTSETTRLPVDTAVRSPAWSPDGRHIAYAAAGIWVLPIGEMGSPKRVVASQWYGWSPKWSPDGSDLYFLGWHSGDFNLWRVRIGDNAFASAPEPELITVPSATVYEIDAARNTPLVAYSAVTKRYQLWKLDLVETSTPAAAGGPATIIKGSRPFFQPELSPDGSQVVYQTGGPTSDIVIIGVDGTQRQRVTRDDFPNRMPQWSPDGQRLAFYSRRESGWNTWIVNSDGSALRPLTKTVGKHIWPVWSPDGRNIAAFDTTTDRMRLFDTSEGGTLTRELPPWPEKDVEFRARSWSRDGRRLVGSLVTHPGNQVGLGLFDFGNDTYTSLADLGQAPAWMPDGAHVLFESERDGRSVLMAVHIDTKEPYELFRSPEGHAFDPSVSSDGQTVYFLHHREESDIWTLTFPP